MCRISEQYIFFFFNDTATTEIYTLSLHDALPISGGQALSHCLAEALARLRAEAPATSGSDRKSTRLNSSHGYISYAVFCLKKKKKHALPIITTFSHTSHHVAEVSHDCETHSTGSV